MPATVLSDRQYQTALQEQHFSLRYYVDDKLVCTEWRGVVPCDTLRQYSLYVCQFILDNNAELVLADYSRMIVPCLEDQVWIANRTEKILRQSRLTRIASVLAPELFQPLGGRSTPEFAAQLHLPCELRDFAHKNDALNWLLAA
ncbi:hypothetical protein C8N40_10941 [Pontibacter mucosus]|uniref:SpoIIAA-like protein n=1 Tax=Pontibacter mucosus TaxID=1649266 RepID=A0A2T5YE11_9BACT|nr:hypothetical protein [Pontibacter mucosus]PTX14943.1 hypothetical protein C8N40_10941 [Pontibacter mucosus]